MALNEQNFRVPTSEEAREIGRKGGIASGKARKEKAQRGKVMRELLQTAIKDPKLLKNLEALGIDTTDANFELAAHARALIHCVTKGMPADLEKINNEAYGKLSDKTALEVSGEVNGININIKHYDKDKK